MKGKQNDIKYSYDNLTYDDMKKNENIKNKTILQIINKRMDFFYYKYCFYSMRAYRIFTTVSAIVIALNVVFIARFFYAMNGKHWGLVFLFLTAIYSFLGFIILGIIYRLVYGKKEFFCAYCGTVNKGTCYCTKCNRRIDINGFEFKRIILRCPKCFEVIVRDEEINACPGCEYKFYKPKKQLTGEKIG